MSFMALAHDVRPQGPHLRPQAVDSRSSPARAQKTQVTGIPEAPHLLVEQPHQPPFPLDDEFPPSHSFSEAEWP
jgi:hypothetical protein